MDYNAFRLHVTTQAAEILRNRRRGGGAHAVEEPRPAAEPRLADEDEGSQDDIVDSYDRDGNFLGSFNRFNGKQQAGGIGGGAPWTPVARRRDDRRHGGAAPGAAGAAGAKRPRLCPNCCKEHAGECKEPRREMKDRKCFDCGGPHLAMDCPNTANVGPATAI